LDFENVKIITLDIVYRCPQHFLDAATNIVKDRSDNKLRSVKKATPRIKIRSFKNPTEEAKWVTKTIEQMVGGLSFVSLDSGAADGHELRSLSDIAILFRARALGDAVAESLSKRGIPVQRMDTPEPLAQKELRSIWRVWEILKGRATQFHLTKLQEEENIQSKKLFDIKSHSQNKDGPQLLDHIIDILGLDPQKPLIRALAHVIKKHPYSDSLAVLLRNEADLMDINIEAVSLLSIHAAKGLEFPIIFLIGCEAGILPWKDADRQEERRLFYVGLTRASENIYISYVKQRRLFGQFMQNGPSPFIDDIPEKFLLKEQTPRTKTLQRPRQKKLF
jgi:superfamily I DNA/RNA helicase